MTTRIGIRLQKWFPLGLCLFVFLLGFGLRGAPAHPDVLFSREQELGVAFIFLGFFLGLLYWGKALLEILQLSQLGWIYGLALGSAGWSCIGLLLGSLGWIGYSSFSALLCGLFLGPLLHSYFWSRSCENQNPPPQPLSGARVLTQGFKGISLVEGVIFGLLIFVWIGFCLNASGAHGTSDPFLYHLLGPRLWVDAGKIYLPGPIPITFQASSWEMLLVLSQILLGAPEGFGLIEGHLFSQYLHVVVGLGGVLAVLFKLSPKESGVPRFWMGVALLGALLTPDLRELSWLGKNDWGVLFWICAGTALLLRPPSSSWRQKALAAFLLGLGCAGKPNSLFFVIPVLGCFALRPLEADSLRKRFFELLGVAGWILLGAAPILIRNWAYTGAPLFPFVQLGLNPELGGPLSSFAQLTPSRLTGTFTFFQSQLRWVLAEHWVYTWIVLGPLLGSFFRDPLLRKLSWILPISSLWFLVLEINHQFVRWLGAPLVLSGFLPVLLLSDLLNRGSGAWRKLGFQSGLALVMALILTSQVEVKGWWAMLHRGSPTHVIRNPVVHLGGDSKAWLRLNATFETPIVTTGDNQLYYLSYLPVTPLSYGLELKRKLESLRHSILIFSQLYQFGYRYVLDVMHWDDQYWTDYAFTLDRAILNLPEAIVFMGPRSKVIDLKVLVESMNQSCVGTKGSWMTPPT
ncbi:MAG: hypothetical protein ACO3A2_00190 [Bdellovibrionia bacterium]